MQGHLRQLRTHLKHDKVEYFLPLKEDINKQQEYPLNALLGRYISLTFTGEIACIHCARKIKKSFNQGFCYPCFTRLAACDKCIMHPEYCHYQQGTCREPKWGEQHCLMPHYVYLSNTSEKIKVGITRESQIPFRWIDQGAVQALPIFKVTQRYYSGLIEVICKQHVTDKTQWQRMLKGNIKMLDMMAARETLWQSIQQEIQLLQSTLPMPEDIIYLDHQNVTTIAYPVQVYPDKVKAFNFDKVQQVAGVLQGIKGQYLLFDTGVINIRKFAGYQVQLKIGH